MIGGPREDEPERQDGERERRGVEDVHALAVLLPAQELLGREGQRDHQELPVEPVRLEPEEQVHAEDDGHDAEADLLLVAPRPAEQGVEGVGEDDLREDDPGRGVDPVGVPTPVDVDGALHERLHPVRPAQDVVHPQRPAAAGRRQEERGVPDEQHAGRAQEGPEHPRARVHRGDEREGREHQGEDQGEAKDALVLEGHEGLKLALVGPETFHRRVAPVNVSARLLHHGRGALAGVEIPGAELTAPVLAPAAHGAAREPGAGVAPAVDDLEGGGEPWHGRTSAAHRAIRDQGTGRGRCGQSQRGPIEARDRDRLQQRPRGAVPELALQAVAPALARAVLEGRAGEVRTGGDRGHAVERDGGPARDLVGLRPLVERPDRGGHEVVAGEVRERGDGHPGLHVGQPLAPGQAQVVGPGHAALQGVVHVVARDGLAGPGAPAQRHLRIAGHRVQAGGRGHRDGHEVRSDGAVHVHGDGAVARLDHAAGIAGPAAELPEGGGRGGMQRHAAAPLQGLLAVVRGAGPAPRRGRHASAPAQVDGQVLGEVQRDGDVAIDVHGQHAGAGARAAAFASPSREHRADRRSGGHGDLRRQRELLLGTGGRASGPVGGDPRGARGDAACARARQGDVQEPRRVEGHGDGVVCGREEVAGRGVRAGAVTAEAGEQRAVVVLGVDRDVARRIDELLGAGARGAGGGVVAGDPGRGRGDLARAIAQRGDGHGVREVEAGRHRHVAADDEGAGPGPGARCAPA